MAAGPSGAAYRESTPTDATVGRVSAEPVCEELRFGNDVTEARHM